MQTSYGDKLAFRHLKIIAILKKNRHNLSSDKEMFTIHSVLTRSQPNKMQHVINAISASSLNI